ncbi:phosphatidylinositol kinase [Novymonas esmeraldas]|uniref:Phosphatidylinositol kinase n=1 Tax=Novymonas esmeraldas TaxID=1808958 RepID=A0AAW0F5P4_9TRYP
MSDAVGAASALADTGAAAVLRMEDPIVLAPSPPPPTHCAGSVWLAVYDRVSHTRFRLHIEDPRFLTLLRNAVVPVAEADGALPFEMHEFVEYLDAYEWERLLQAAAARRGATSSSSNVLGASSLGGSAVSSGGRGIHSDPALSAAAAMIAGHASGSGGGGGCGASVTSATSTTSPPGTGTGLGNAASTSSAAPCTLSETLRQTMRENSDFFFRVASVAYHIDPNSSSGGGGGGGGASRWGDGLASLLTNTIGAASAPASAAGAAASTAAPPRQRSYSMPSGYSAAFHLCGYLFGAVYIEHCRALAQKIADSFFELRVEDCVKFRKAVWAGFHLKAPDPYRTGARSESNLEVRWVSEKIKDDQHLFPTRGVVPPQQESSHASRLVDATLSYVANARGRGQPSGGSIHVSSSNANNGSSSGRGGGAGGPGGAGGGAAVVDGGGGGGGGGAALATARVSAMGGDTGENEMHTFGLAKLLHNPSWQKDDESSDSCPSCHRAFISVARPLGTRAHHCRSCGVRLCVFCITKRAHYSFAKLAKPGSSDETDERLVCDTCYKEYETVSQLHYLGTLFAFAGMSFSDLALCRTVNEQWRNAAELCISEYRLLLHSCNADLRSVKTSVGALLQNSVFLLLGEGPTSSISVVHHPEAALLLLQFIAREKLWMMNPSYYFISRLSSSVLNRADTVLTDLPGLATAPAATSAEEQRHRNFRLPVVPKFSHWHLFCTAFCSRISSSYFFVKCAEHLCTAPAEAYDAYVATALERMTRVYLCTTPLWKRLAEANSATAAAAAAAGTATSSPLPLPSLSDQTEGQLVTLWLLDMLHQDALVPAPRRRFQQLLERILPTVAGSSLSLVFIMLLSLQSTYSYYHYDEDLFGLWRSRIVAEVGRRDPVARDRVVATLDFFNGLDRFCAQAAVVSQSSVVGWIVDYCSRAAPWAVVAGSAARQSSPHRYIDLPQPLLNPFKPHIVLKSIRLSGVKVAPNAASKPTWIAFNTWTAAEHLAYEARATAESAASPPSPHARTLPIDPASAAAAAAPLECMFLYKRENVERDQLMCVSSRLLQTLLLCEIGDAEMLDYSVLPLSCDSGLIEKAEGRELSNLDNMDITSFVLQRGSRGCVNFLASAKLFLLLNYIFSIGDRHKGNVLIGTNGALLHIDFRFIFSEKTFVEKLSRTTVRIDGAFLAAVEQCQQRQGSFFAGASPPGSPGISSGARRPTTSPMGVREPSSAELREAFFRSAAEWFVHVRPFAAVFYELWLYAVHRRTVPYSDTELGNMLNTLFDRHASQASSASNFSTTMKESVNVCRLKDVTHSSAEVLRSFADQVSRRVSESGVDAVKMVGTMWSSWWSRGA